MQDSSYNFLNNLSKPEMYDLYKINNFSLNIWYNRNVTDFN